jgi:hypothetical protein
VGHGTQCVVKGSYCQCHYTGCTSSCSVGVQSRARDPVRGEGELLSVPLLSILVHVLLVYRVGHGTQCVVKGSYRQCHYCLY